MSEAKRVCPICQHRDDGSRRWFWTGAAGALRRVCDRCVTRKKGAKRE